MDSCLPSDWSVAARRIAASFGHQYAQLFLVMVFIQVDCESGCCLLLDCCPPPLPPPGSLLQADLTKAFLRAALSLAHLSPKAGSEGAARQRRNPRRAHRSALACDERGPDLAENRSPLLGPVGSPLGSDRKSWQDFLSRAAAQKPDTPRRYARLVAQLRSAVAATEEKKEEKHLEKPLPPFATTRL